MHSLIRFAFNQFYTHFAWTYDVVADVVSFGEWKEWGRAAIPFIEGRRVLEIAHGPGHVHLALRQRGFDVIGLDLSRQMGQIAHQRVTRVTGRPPSLVRASALRLPFASSQFDTVLTTFPAKFIFELDTLNEVRRVLKSGGRFVIVPGARFRRSDLATRALEFAYRITGQGETPIEAVRRRFESAGYTLESHAVQTKLAAVTVWFCTTPSPR